MNDRDKIIGFIDKQKEAVGTMKDASAEINIIAINAAIESAHAASGIRIMTEKILDTQMTSNCRLLASVLANGGFTLDHSTIAEYARWINVDEIYITDADAVTVGTNIEAAYGWRFPEDPKAQAFAFRELITQKDGVLAQPIKIRDIDNLMFKFVGVSRIDQPGIVQVGYKAESILQYQTEIGAVFGVLADAISTLGGKVTRTAKGMLDSVLELEKELSES